MSRTRGWSSVIHSWPPPFAIGAIAQALDMIDVLPIGIALLDLRGECYQTNSAFAETVGRHGEMPSTILDIVVPEDRQALATAIGDILGWRSYQLECRLRLAIRAEETAVVTLVRAPAGWNFGVLLAVRDIREQIRLEQQVAQATKMQAVGQLAGGVAHDFNNILTAVLGLTDELLTRHLPGTSDFADLDQIRQNAVRAAKLTGQLLAFARQQTLRPQTLDVGQVVAGVMPLLRQLAGADIELVNLTEGSGSVRADPGQLEQVLTNLAVNARDAMNGSGRLVIAARMIAASEVAALGHSVMPAVDFVALTVSDTGTGIPAAIAGKIFEPFFTTKPVGEGTGLGLSTVYGIVKQTGGFIFAQPAEGGGTCFAVYLPATDAAKPDLPPPPPTPLPALSGTVLLVEDDRAVRFVVERVLRRAGLVVTSASDGHDALAVLEAQAPDLLVSDVVMPGIDGVELVERIGARWPRLPVVLMSGYAEPPQRRTLVDAGVIFLAKPFAAGDLLRAVRSALDERRLDTAVPPRDPSAAFGLPDGMKRI